MTADTTVSPIAREFYARARAIRTRQILADALRTAEEINTQRTARAELFRAAHNAVSANFWADIDAAVDYDADLRVIVTDWMSDVQNHDAWKPANRVARNLPWWIPVAAIASFFVVLGMSIIF